MNSMQLQLNDWRLVEQWLDNNFHLPPSYLNLVNQRDYPVDAFTLGQLFSKAWLIITLKQVITSKSVNEVVIHGAWIGAIVPLLHNAFDINRIYGLDISPDAVSQSDKFNNRYVMDSWKYKGIVADSELLNSSDMQFQTQGEILSSKPEWLINTSCEHMNTNWFDTASSDQLIIMQTNDNPDLSGHVNACECIEEMQDRYALSNTLFCGEADLPLYKRFMQIGYK